MKSASRLLALLVLFNVFLGQGFAQSVMSPTMLGELKIVVLNSQTPSQISVEAQGNVWGSTHYGYPLTHDYDSFSTTAQSFPLEAIDRYAEPNSGPNVIAYGLYKITIDGSSIYVDWRDAGYPASYSQPDLYVYFNKLNGNFYKDHLFNFLISAGSTVGIWQDGRKYSGSPSQSNFLIPTVISSVPSGIQASIDYSPSNLPATYNFSIQSTHVLDVPEATTLNGLIYNFASWNTGGSRVKSLFIDANQTPNTELTATYSFVKSANINVTSLGGEPGTPITITWSIPSNPDITYYVYRKTKLGSPQLLAILAHNVSSFVDDTYNVPDIGDPSTLLFYDVRAYYSPYSAFADANFTACNGTVNNDMLAFSNFPNPFNPSTNITFVVNEAGPVTLKIYDIVGREVASLVDEFMQKGAYIKTWNASQMSSGLYLCRFTNKAKSSIKQLMLTK